MPWKRQFLKLKARVGSLLFLSETLVLHVRVEHATVKKAKPVTPSSKTHHTAVINFVVRKGRFYFYLRTNSRTTPATIAPTPAQMGMFTVSLSLTESSIGPSLASCVSLV